MVPLNVVGVGAEAEVLAHEVEGLLQLLAKKVLGVLLVPELGAAESLGSLESPKLTEPKWRRRRFNEKRWLLLWLNRQHIPAEWLTCWLL